MTDRRLKRECHFCGAKIRRLGAHVGHFHRSEIAAMTCPHGVYRGGAIAFCEPCGGDILSDR